MISFKKLLIPKVITLITTIVTLCLISTAYGIDLSNKAYLRGNSLLDNINTQQDKARIQEALLREMLQAIPVKEIASSSQFRVYTSDKLDVVLRLPKSREETETVLRQRGFDGTMTEQDFNRFVDRIHAGKQRGMPIYKERLSKSNGVFETIELDDVDILVEEMDGSIKSVKEKKLYAQGKARKVLRDILGELYRKGEIAKIKDMLNQVIQKTQEELWERGVYDVGLLAFPVNWGIDYSGENMDVDVRMFDFWDITDNYEEAMSELRRLIENNGMETAWSIMGKEDVSSILNLTDENIARWFLKRVREEFTTENLERYWGKKLGPINFPNPIRKIRGDQIEFVGDEIVSFTIVQEAVYTDEKGVRHECFAKRLVIQYDSDNRSIIIPQARILRYLNSKNIQGIPEVIDLVELPDGRKLILFKKFPNGELLDEKIERLSPMEAVDIMIQVTRIVKSLLDEGIYHWDIKPKNIYVTDEGEVILFDFDFVFMNEEEFWERQLYKAGTPSYMSQNRLTRGHFSHADEIYSLGVTLAETALAGASKNGVFLEDTPQGIINMLRDLYAILPALKDLIRNALSKQNPGARISYGISSYRDIREFLIALEKVRTSMATEEELKRKPPSMAVLTNSRIMKKSADRINMPTQKDLAERPQILTPAAVWTNL